MERSGPMPKKQFEHLVANTILQILEISNNIGTKSLFATIFASQFMFLPYWQAEKPS